MDSTKLNYLTVQDVLWINLQVTGTVNAFRYADLEEATFLQYGYGDSNDLNDQAARFLKGFLAKAPLSVGNEPTAFVAFATFLRLNGYHLNLDDGSAAAWVQRGSFDVASVVDHEPHDHKERMRDAVTQVRVAFEGTVQALGGDALNVVADGAIH